MRLDEKRVQPTHKQIVGIALATALGLAGAPGDASGQPASQPGEAEIAAPAATQRGAVRADQPEISTRQNQAPRELQIDTAELPAGVVIPDVPDEYARQLSVQTMAVTDILLEGNTVLDPADVAVLLEQFEGPAVSFENLQSARTVLTEAYILQGYVSSGVLIPDQEVVDGTVRLTAHESGLGDINISGNQHLRSSFIEKRLRQDLGPVLNVYELENSLRLMQQRPLIDTVNAEIIPGENRGENILNLQVKEAKPLTVSAGYNNHRSPSVGEDQYVVSAAHQSLTGNGDYLAVNYGQADGQDNLAVVYGIPLTAQDLTLETYYIDGQSDIVESPFEDLDIVSKTKTWGVKLYRPVVRSLEHNVVVGLTFENAQNESFLLGSPFSFSPGERLGESEVSVLRLSTDWTWRRDQDAIALRGTLNQGVNWLNATENGDLPGNLPDSEFTSFLFQAHYARALPWWGMQILGRFTGQLSSDPLLAVEKLAVGGARTVRGYRENQLVRDEGLIASVEMRIPLFIDDAGRSRIGLTFAPFFDYGISIDKRIDLPGLDDPSSQEIASVGAGLIWNWWEPLYAEVYYGDALKDVGNSNDSLQERGVHVLVNLQWSL